MGNVATLDNFGVTGSDKSLPLQFSYSPPVPNLRYTLHKTADGMISVHTAGNVSNAGNAGGAPADAVIPWTMEGATRAEWFAFLSLYTNPASALTDLTFKGYWGEEMEVRCLKISLPVVRARLFNFSGEFQVMSVKTWGSAS